ncbi:GyrI-like domain-containing protein [Paenibacillus sp.]|uniref:GyrI-like domain-containing protein n=1 Tax=Paenibacillus sp. TaxID=58172 RepID=UPI0035672140
MIPQIQSKPSLYVVGIKQTHRLTEGAPIPTIAEQWGVFASRRHEIEGHGPVTLGLSLCADPSRGTIDYVAGALVSRLPDAVPDGLEALELEPHTYAVFTHRGPVAGLAATYPAIYAWLGENGEYTRAAAPEFEWYDERYTGVDAEDSAFDIYVPVLNVG